MATYLVTGAAGFIGSALVRALLERGERVRAIDNFTTGKRENIADLRQSMEFFDLDLNDGERLVRVCGGVECVFHEAAIPSVPKSVADPRTSHRANVDGMLSLLLAAREAGVGRVIYAASSSAYGDTPALPKREEMKPNPISPYAVQKLCGELYAAAFHRVYGLQTTALRYFNVFGPRQDASSPYSGVLSQFITCMLAGRAPTIFGDGTQSRDFTYIDNVVHANLLAAGANASEIAGRTFNIATGVRFSLNDVFELLKLSTGYRGNPLYERERAGDVKHSLADITAAWDAFGYRPVVGFKEGLRRTVAWYREQSRTAQVSPAVTIP